MTAPRSRPDHAGKEARLEVHQGLDVQPDHPDLALALLLGEGAEPAVARVVHQHLDVEPELADRRGERVARGGLGEVGADHLGADVVGAGELRGQRGEPVLAPGDEGDAVAAAREAAGDLLADPRGGAGDERGRVGLRRGQGHRRGSLSVRPGRGPDGPTIGAMEGSDAFGGLFGDPDELRERLAEMAEQMQSSQKVAWADNAIKLAVDMTVASINRLNLQGTSDDQADAGPRRDPDRLPRGRHARARGARGALLASAKRTRFAHHPRAVQT